MTAKEELKQIKKLDTQIRIKELEIRDIENRMTGCAGITYEEKVQSGSPNEKSPQEKWYPLLDKYQKQLSQQVMDLMEYKEQVRQKLDRLKEPNHMDLLYKRYFEFKEWVAIAQEMHYSYRGILKLHGRALQEYEKECTQVHIQK